MAKVLLLTNSQGASAEVLPALGLLQHTCKVAPLEASVLVDTPVMDIVFVDARRDLPTAKSLTRLLSTTGVGAPIIAITTEGGLTAFTADWGANDVILDTAGPAEVDARIRLVIARLNGVEEQVNPEIERGDLVIDESAYSVKIKEQLIDLTLLKSPIFNVDLSFKVLHFHEISRYLELQILLDFKLRLHGIYFKR